MQFTDIATDILGTSLCQQNFTTIFQKCNCFFIIRLEKQFTCLARLCQELAEDTLGCHPRTACGRVDDGHGTAGSSCTWTLSIGRNHPELGPAQGALLQLVPVDGGTSLFLSGYFFLRPKSLGMRLDWDKGTDTDCFPGAARD